MIMIDITVWIVIPSPASECFDVIISEYLARWESTGTIARTACSECCDRLTASLASDIDTDREYITAVSAGGRLFYQIPVGHKLFTVVSSVRSSLQSVKQS